MEGDSALWVEGVVIKQEPPWPMNGEPSDQPSPAHSTAQPVSGSIAGLQLSRHVCGRCPAVFVLVSSLELHMAACHGEPLPFSEVSELPVSSGVCGLGSQNTDKMNTTEGRSSTKTMDHVTRGSEDSAGDFVLKLEPPWSSDEEPQDQPSALHSPAHSVSEDTVGSSVSLNQRDRSAVERTRDALDISDFSEKDEENVRKRHACDECSKVFTRADSLKKHKWIHAGHRPFVCDTCSKTFTQASALTRHKLIHSGHKPYVCDVCSKGFTGLDRLRGHKCIYTNRLKSFQCDMCDKAFTNAGNLNRHKLVHTSHKALECDVCVKAFTHGDHLKRHKRIHTGERPYKCSQCHADFNQSGSLHAHVRSVHARYRPFICDVCEAAFSKANALKRHQRTHTGEKPYICDVCWAAFADNGHLTIHKRSHTGEKPYVCTDCGKCFACSSTLKNHRLTHTGQKPKLCPHCPAVFTWLCDLKKHVQRLHR